MRQVIKISMNNSAAMVPLQIACAVLETTQAIKPQRCVILWVVGGGSTVRGIMASLRSSVASSRRAPSPSCVDSLERVI